MFHICTLFIIVNKCIEITKKFLMAFMKPGLSTEF